MKVIRSRTFGGKLLQLFQLQYIWILDHRTVDEAPGALSEVRSRIIVLTTSRDTSDGNAEFNETSLPVSRGCVAEWCRSGELAVSVLRRSGRRNLESDV